MSLASDYGTFLPGANAAACPQAGESGLCIVSRRLAWTLLGDYISSVCGRVMTARMLGVTVPPSLLALADEVIE